MNIDIWRQHILLSEWMTPDVDMVSLTLSAEYRQTQNTTIICPCDRGVAIGMSCERQTDALKILEQQGLVEFVKGGLTDGCCFSFDRIELKAV